MYDPTQRIILLVEDNADDELMTLRAFRKSNIHNPVVVVRDGAEAIDYLFIQGKHANRNPDIRPQVILLDLHLPRIDGLEVLRRIRAHEQTRTLPVVVLTSSKEERDLVDSYQLGVNSFVHKPVDVSSFFEAVRQLGMYWLVLNEMPLPRRGS
ncbi:putative two-component response regulator [Cystobacter fuscus DSM 2262]|uniref:Two-component response regulator n=1 Tax=Cystobacter fuscus (strain ATCC 25194 / DSM 2262 / NBRC 100088 / M29) TaxID=1242864 RepID=S9P9D3_CYSF2|nr:response regulator [Cystobacter fuscus]EPX59711.1 putative two-component response regulator [Cystobacter fuscus DSM 2262]